MAAALRFPPADIAAGRLYPRCIFCGGEFPGNALFGRVPPGSRLTYDPAKGRLWSVCERCRRWNLIPLDERFDAIETLERAVRDRARLVASTAHVALYTVEDLTVVRVGAAPLAERVEWRYGRKEIARRVIWHSTAARLGAATLGALAEVGGHAGIWRHDRESGATAVVDLLRWRRFGSTAWYGRSPCPSCGSVLRELRFDVSWWLHPRLEEGRLVVGVPCTRCDPWTPEKVFDVRGLDAELVLRRVLAYQHVAGAAERELRAAMWLLESAGDPTRLVQQLATGRSSIWRLGSARALALEIALNHVAERRMVDLRLHDVEAEWRAEESLAHIVDDELS
jgi:hypothetical protein